MRLLKGRYAVFDIFRSFLVCFLLTGFSIEPPLQLVCNLYLTYPAHSHLYLIISSLGQSAVSSFSVPPTMLS